MKLLLPILLLASGPAFAADRFDLLCTGTRAFHDPLAPRPIALPYQTEVRIDLTGNRYCYGECQRTRPIAAADGNVIALETPQAARTSDLPREDTTIDRHSWAYRSEVANPAPDRRTTSVRATCTVAPFKGIPASDTHY